MAKEKAVELDLAKIRNFGIIAHIDAGKTTTSEHILFYSGATHLLGTVDKGNTTTDWNEEEQERGITIYSACIPFQWRDCNVNLIDTPGHVDFTAEVERSLRVLDGCVVVFDAQKGVEAQSETVWRQADKYRVPRLVFINKMDVVGANFVNALAKVRERLDANPVVLVIPVGSGGASDSPKPFEAVIDLLEQKVLYFNPDDYGKTIRSEPVPEELAGEVAAWRETLFDQLTANDDKDRITSAYLDGREIPLETLRSVIREQTLARQIQPVLCGSGRNHIGIQPLLDACTEYLPSPLDRPPVVGTNPSPKKKDKEESRKCDPKEPFAGLVFKIVASPHGELYYVRIYSGTLKMQSRVQNAGRDGKELIGKVYHTMADPNERREIPEAYAGDIVALLGLKLSATGDTLCDAQHPILLEPITFAEPVVSQSIEPESSADKDRLTELLTILRREDPTFVWRDDRETGQKLMSGMGTLHLEIKKHRLERDFKIKIRVGKPRVSYRETIKSAIEIEGDAANLASGTNQVARVTVRFEPHEGPIAVVNKLKSETIPAAFEAVLEQSLRNNLDSGELGFPLMNVRATILAASMDESLSTDLAFHAAGTDAVRRAMQNNTILLEPVMRLEVTVPDDYLGAIAADLNARRAQITNQTPVGKVWVVEAIVALSKMFDYANAVRSISAGRASYTMEPREYRPAPDEVRRKMLDPFAS